MIQEARGTQEDLQELLDLFPRLRAWGAFLQHGGGGGVVMMVAPALLGLYTDISHEVPVRGCVHRLSFRGGRGPPLDLTNVRLSAEAGVSLAARVRTIGESIAPLREAATLVAGDFNLLAPGEGRL